jgi:hypothetical protein
MRSCNMNAKLMVASTAIAFLILGCSAPQNTTSYPRKEPLGANLDGVTDWSRCFMFANLMKQARAFGTPEKPWEAGKTQLDAAGWPKEDFGVVLMAALKDVKNVGGTFKMSFDCKVKPAISSTASTADIKNLAGAAGKWTADLVVPQNAEQLMLSFRNTSGGVRNLKIMRPIPSEGHFTKQFVDHIRRFTTLRFMDWGSTNNNKIVKWSERTLVESPSWAKETGVPWEVMIDLANTAKADAWICIPIHADQNYIDSLAALCKKRLDPSLKLYIENSNEVWNWGFEQAQYNLQEAKRIGAASPDISWDGKENEWTWPARNIAKRLMQIRSSFAKAYGADFSKTVRPVLASQIVWPDNWLEQGLKYLEHNHGAPNKVIYAFADAPYFNLESLKDKQGKEQANLTKEQVLDALEHSIDTMPEWGQFKKHQDWSNKYGVKWLSYEAGPDTFGPDNVAAKKAAQFDPRMRKLLLKYYRKWREGGGELMNYFIAGATNYDTQFGTWGLTDDMSKTDSPKVQALDEILSGRWK